MVIACLIVALICVGLFIFATVNNKRLEKRADAADAEAERLRQYYESETLRIQNETQSALANAQALLDQQLDEAKQESECLRQHYQSEAHKSQVAAEALVAKTLKELEPLRKYVSLREPEAEAQRLLLPPPCPASASVAGPCLTQ
jgi:Skp family chaperone for outer membrane proteins